MNSRHAPAQSPHDITGCATLALGDYRQDSTTLLATKVDRNHLIKTGSGLEIHAKARPRIAAVMPLFRCSAKLEAELPRCCFFQLGDFLPKL